MTSERNDNILEDAVPELLGALKNNQFGIESYDILQDGNDTEAQVKARARAGAEIKLKDGEEIIVRLDQSGWTLEQLRPIPNNDGNRLTDLIDTTYESLESLLITLSPTYVKAMNGEIWKRFGMVAPSPEEMDPSQEQGDAGQ